MKLLKKCQAFDSAGYRTHKEDLALDVVNGILINPWHYNEPIVILKDNFRSSEFENTAEVKMLCAAWTLFVDSDKLHSKAKEIGADILTSEDPRFAEITKNY